MFFKKIEILFSVILLFKFARSIDFADIGILENPLPFLYNSILSNESSEANKYEPFNPYLTLNNNLNTLRFLSVLTRHGSRSPIFTYPTDSYPFYNSRYWPNGPGELTRYGKQQMFSVGQLIRIRYNGFLDVNYYPNATYVRANPLDRNYMSALTILSGLYPPVGFQIWNPYILWQPIPVWNNAFDVNDLLFDVDLCPKFTRAADEEKILLKELNYEFHDLFTYLSNYTGTIIDDLENVFQVYDVLKFQHENGFTLPVWTKQIFPDRIAKAAALAFRNVFGGSIQITRLTAGPVLKEILQQLRGKAQGKLNLRLHLDVTHDTTLQAVLSALQFDELITIDSSAYIIFELHENAMGHFVKVLFYKNGDAQEPKILKLPFCGSPCSLANFSSYIQSISPDNWKEECQI